MMDPITPSNVGCKYSFVVKKKHNDSRRVLALTPRAALEEASNQPHPQPAALLLSGVLMNNLDALPEQHIWAAVRHGRAVLGEEVVMTELKRRQFVMII